MRFLSNADCDRWMAAAGVTPRGGELVSLERSSSVFSAEKISAAQLYSLARFAVRWIREYGSQTAMCRVLESSVWESDENRFLYQMLRHKHGDRDSVEESPGHLFLRCEDEDGVAVVFLTMMFGWHMALTSGGSPRWFEVDYDGMLYVRGSHNGDADSVVRYAESLTRQ